MSKKDISFFDGFETSEIEPLDPTSEWKANKTYDAGQVVWRNADKQIYAALISNNEENFIPSQWVKVGGGVGIWVANNLYKVNDAVIHNTGTGLRLWLCATENSDATFSVGKWTEVSSDLEVKNLINDHKANTSNPHNVTKAQLGLSKVLNLAPDEMPISTAVSLALTGLDNQNTITYQKTVENKDAIDQEKLDRQQADQDLANTYDLALMFQNGKITALEGRADEMEIKTQFAFSLNRLYTIERMVYRFEDNKIYRCVEEHESIAWFPEKWQVLGGEDYSVDINNLKDVFFSKEKELRVFENYDANSYLPLARILGTISSSGVNEVQFNGVYPVTTEAGLAVVSGYCQLLVGATTTSNHRGAGGITYCDYSTLRPALIASGKKVIWKRKSKMKIGNSQVPNGADISLFFGIYGSTISSNFHNLPSGGVPMFGLQFGGTSTAVPDQTKLYLRKVTGGNNYYTELSTLSLNFFEVEIHCELDPNNAGAVFRFYFNGTLIDTWTVESFSQNYVTFSRACGSLSSVSNTNSKAILIDWDYVSSEIL